MAVSELQGQPQLLLQYRPLLTRRPCGQQRQHTANIMSGPTPYAQHDPPKQQKILTIDCRGLEFLEFKPDGGWKAKGTDSGTPFEDIDLSEDWYDYDDKAGEEVSVKEAKWAVVRA